MILGRAGHGAWGELCFPPSWTLSTPCKMKSNGTFYTAIPRELKYLNPQLRPQSLHVIESSQQQ